MHLKLNDTKNRNIPDSDVQHMYIPVGTNLLVNIFSIER